MVKLARQLHAMEIPVLLTVQIDSVGLNDALIPPNVRRAGNLYQRDGRIIRGEPRILAEDSTGTEIILNQRFSYRERDIDISGVAWHKKLFRIDLSRPQERVQLTFGLSNDTQPSFSADGSIVYFASDRNEPLDSESERTGAFNIYGLELATDTVRRYTNILFGAFFPQPIPGADRELLFSSFGDQAYNLYRMDLPEAMETYSALDAALSEERVEEIEREIAEASTVELDQNNVSQSASGGWHIENIQVAGGVTSRGTILSNTAIVITDLLGNHRITAILGSIESQRNYTASYTNLRTRFNWGAMATSQRSFFFTFDPVNRDFDRQAFYELDGVEAFGEYPLSRNNRLEFSVGYFRRGFGLDAFLQDTAGQVTTLQNRFSDGTYVPIGLALIGDKARFKPYGAFAGHRYRFDIKASPIGSLQFTDFIVDWRQYLQITADSQIALRLYGAVSTGDDPNVFFFGGLNQLRGFDFLQFAGNRTAFLNLEYRFPFIYEARAGAIALTNIRGTLFFDIGAAWFQDDDDFQFFEDGRLRDGVASFGLGLSFNFGPIPLNWYLAQVTDLKGFQREVTVTFFDGTRLLETRQREGCGFCPRLSFYLGPTF